MAYNPFRHFGLKVLSVAIAALLWVLVGGEKIVERSLRVPLELQNIPDGVEMVGEMPGTVDVRVRGSSSALGNLSAGDVMALMDLTNAGAGRHLFHLAPDDVRVPFGVEVKSVAPATTTLVFERTMTKTVPVVPSIEGQPAPGYAVERIATEPTEVAVIGPESALRGLQQAVTEPVPIEGATSSVRESVTIGMPNSAARLKNGRTARVLVEIAATRTERTIANVAMRMFHLREGRAARSTPSAVVVTVRGQENVLQRLTADVIEASVDLSGLGPGRYDLSVTIASSRAFSVVRIDPAQVQIAIK
ncbi:MAG: CdaR family protein [Acidobacteria bacterium]|nr:CdaR family protein [Acidobacteriota bacterium]